MALLAQCIVTEEDAARAAAPASEPGLEALLAARAGDAEAGRWLMQCFGASLLRTAWSVVGRYGTVEAEDIVQEAFLAALTTNALPNGTLGPWLRSIAVRKALDWLRQHRRRREDPILEVQTETWSTGRQPRVEVVALRQALATMAPRDRAILLLVDIEGHSMAEAAATLGCTTVAAKLRAVRARRKLARLMEGEGR